MTIEHRISVLEKTIERATPGMTVTLTDGRQIVTDGGGAVDLVKRGEAARVECNRPGSGHLDELLTALCTG